MFQLPGEAGYSWRQRFSVLPVLSGERFFEPKFNRGQAGSQKMRLGLNREQQLGVVVLPQPGAEMRGGWTSFQCLSQR